MTTLAVSSFIASLPLSSAVKLIVIRHVRMTDARAVKQRIVRPILLGLVFAGLAGAMPGFAASGSGRRAARHRPRSAAERSTADPVGSTPAPSGVPMPVGNVPGWREVFADNFTGTSLDSRWKSYWGVPGGDPGGFYDPRHVTVAGGELVISAYKDPRDDAWDAGPNTYVT